MSYDIELTHPVTKEVLILDAPHDMRGGTYQIGGTTNAHLNITFNYSKIYYRPDVLGEKGIRTIYGMSGAESIPVLKKAIDILGNDIDNNYWICTEGNAKVALTQLLALAQMRPDGVWMGD